MMLALFLGGFLMLMHTKHEPLDAVIHWLLGCTSWAAAAFVALELHAGNASFLASVGRSFWFMMQGLWLFQVGAGLCTVISQRSAGSALEALGLYSLCCNASPVCHVRV